MAQIHCFEGERGRVTQIHLFEAGESAAKIQCFEGGEGA